MMNCMGDMMNGMMNGMMSGMMGFGMPGLLMMLLGVLVVIGFIFLLVWLIRQLGSGTGNQAASTSTGSGHEAPLTILQRRYARGEIASEEYQRIKADLLGE